MSNGVENDPVLALKQSLKVNDGFREGYESGQQITLGLAMQ
jgi:hypothetical protein